MDPRPTLECAYHSVVSECWFLSVTFVCVLLLRPDRGAEYCDERVCLSVCLCLCLSVRDYIFGTTRPIFTKFILLDIYDRNSILFWRRSDTLCTSGFTYDVIFAHKPRLLDVAAQLRRSSHAALGLAINGA